MLQNAHIIIIKNHPRVYYIVKYVYICGWNRCNVRLQYFDDKLSFLNYAEQPTYNHYFSHKQNLYCGHTNSAGTCGCIVEYI